MTNDVVNTWSIRALLDGLASDVPDARIVDITADSREVCAGSAFVAVPGIQTHGLSFAGQAIDNGATVLLYEPTPDVAVPAATPSLRIIAVPNLSQHVGTLADRFFAAPSAALQVIAVTGTNGKTTSAYLLPEALALLNQPAGYAGTLGYGHVNALKHSAHTTADCITVHRQLAAMRDAGDKYVAMEVSSHALDQHRIDGVRVQGALFTNLTRDHLDYHGTLAAYGAAKERLFHRDGLRFCAINADDDFGRDMIARLTRRADRARLTAFAATPAHRALGDRQLFATQVTMSASGISLAFDGTWGQGKLRSQLIGAFNAENLLGVLAMLLELGTPLEQAVRALERCQPPPGRMETLRADRRPLVVIDYAHTPDALAKVLQTARAHSPGRVICVFGCGGDRDPGKRPLMGAIAEQHADVVLLTDDNPRTEDPNAIIADIQQGFDRPDAVTVVRDRAAAIARGIAMGNANDLVLIAGKGHEDYQIIGRNVKRFSDREVALRCLGSAP